MRLARFDYDRGRGFVAEAPLTIRVCHDGVDLDRAQARDLLADDSVTASDICPVWLFDSTTGTFLAAFVHRRRGPIVIGEGIHQPDRENS